MEKKSLVLLFYERECLVLWTGMSALWKRTSVLWRRISLLWVRNADLWLKIAAGQSEPAACQRDLADAFQIGVGILHTEFMDEKRLVVAIYER